MKSYIGIFLGLVALILMVDVGLVLIDDGTPPRTFDEYVTELFGVLSIMVAIPVARRVSAPFQKK